MKLETTLFVAQHKSMTAWREAVRKTVAEVKAAPADTLAVMISELKTMRAAAAKTPAPAA